jgi:hypothetical protein
MKRCGTIRRISDIAAAAGRYRIAKPLCGATRSGVSAATEKPEMAVVSRLTEISREHENVQGIPPHKCALFAFDIFVRGCGRLPFDKLDRAKKHDYDVSKEYRQRTPRVAEWGWGKCKPGFSVTRPGAMAPGFILIG